MAIHRHGVAVIDIAKIQAGIEDLNCNIRTSDAVRFKLLTRVDCNQNLENVSFRIPVSDAVDVCKSLYMTFSEGVLTSQTQTETTLRGIRPRRS